MADIKRWLQHPPDALGQARYLASRRQSASRADAIARDLVAGWDQSAFKERFRPYWDPFAGTGPSKYLDLDCWVREAALRYTALGLFDDGRRQRVLDIGCGCGYFLAVCRAMGHEVLGLDLDDEPLYNDMIRFLDLPRVVHFVTPDEPLPPVEGPFDLITSFMTCFNFRPDGTTWSADEWARLIAKLLPALAPDGRVVIKFNMDARSGQYYPPALRVRVDAVPGARSQFFGDHLVVRRVKA